MCYFRDFLRLSFAWGAVSPVRPRRPRVLRCCRFAGSVPDLKEDGALADMDPAAHDQRLDNQGS